MGDHKRIPVLHPQDQKFYKNIAIVMGIYALNSQYWDWFEMPKFFFYRLQRLVVLYSIPFAAVSQVAYIVINHGQHDFESLSMMYAILPVTIIMCVKVFSSQTSAYKKVMQDFMSKIHLYNSYAKDLNDYDKQVLIGVERLTHWTMYYYIFFCYSCYIGWELVPIVHNFQRYDNFDNITTRLEVVVHFWLPFDYEYNFTNWIIAQVASFYCGFIAVTIIAMFDTINLSFIYHIIGHIKIFKYRLKTLLVEGMTQDEIKIKIIEISQYYNFILETIKNVEAAYGFNVASIYLHNLFGGGLFIYQISMSGTKFGTMVTYGLMLPLYMGILIIISFALEYVRIVADDVPDLIYNLNWEGMSACNQKMILLVLFRSQTILEFKAAFNMKTGMQPAINIIKTTFSYYVMIKSRDE